MICFFVEHFGLQIVDEDDLTYDLSEVMKTGGVTGNTTGILRNNNSLIDMSSRVDQLVSFCLFNCYEISNSHHQFCESGDSGSVVFLCNENGIKTNKAIGIAVAVDRYGKNRSAFACNIREIVRAFNIVVAEQD